MKRIGLSPSKKLFVFLVSAVLITLPLGYAYNSIALILFVLYSVLAAKKDDIHLDKALLLPIALYLLMALSLLWSIDVGSSLKALSKEASLLFIPLALFLNRRYIRMGKKYILKNFSIAMVFAGIFLLARACYRYMQSGNIDVFFYHELATVQVNAIYISALFSIPMFYFLTVKRKHTWNYLAFIFMFSLIFLLASKTVIVIDVLLTAIYVLFFSRMPKKARVTVFLIFLASAGAMGYYSKVKDRLIAEFTTEAQMANGVNNLTLKDAWQKEQFTANDYFNGSAFRVYQFRIFTEMLEEDAIALTGYGLNASPQKVFNKGVEHNVNSEGSYGYGIQNFHNQYVETFADLGIFGFILLLIMLGVNLKNGLKNKDFIHIAFAILMIALLLTESFLWRQRGVVFFTVLYCLFNSIRAKGFEKGHEKNIGNGGSGFSGVTSL